MGKNYHSSAQSWVGSNNMITITGLQTTNVNGNIQYDYTSIDANGNPTGRPAAISGAENYNMKYLDEQAQNGVDYDIYNILKYLYGTSGEVATIQQTRLAIAAA